MTLIEKLENRLYSLRKKQRFEEDECFALEYKDNANGFEQALDIVKQHSDWVSVSERLPESKTYVLVFFGDKYIEIAFYTEGLFAFDETLQMFKELDKPIPRFSVVGCTVNNPTHWCELPQPPSEVQSV